MVPGGFSKVAERVHAFSPTPDTIRRSNVCQRGGCETEAHCGFRPQLPGCDELRTSLLTLLAFHVSSSIPLLVILVENVFAYFVACFLFFFKSLFHGVPR